MVVEKRKVGGCLRHLLNVQYQVLWTGREKNSGSVSVEHQLVALRKNIVSFPQSHVTA